MSVKESLVAAKPVPIPVRIADRIDVGDCWEWTGGLATNGYGRIRFDGRVQAVHRIVYELLVGVIPEGLDLDHLCRNRKCVNPDHLEPVTRSENLRRGYLGGNTRGMQWDYCDRGQGPHRMEGNNILMRRNGRDSGLHRSCRECRNIQQRRNYAKRKANA